MATNWQELQREPLSWEDYLDLDEDLRRDLELVDGYVVPREQRSHIHQKVGFRVAAALEQAAQVEMRGAGGAECYEVNTEVEVLLWEVPPTVRVPDVVLHRCIEPTEFLRAEHVVLIVEVLSKWSERRDRIHKMNDYGDAGVPHYWLVQHDKQGALTIQRYALTERGRPYDLVGTTQRDMGPKAVEVSAPFPMQLLWDSLLVDPPA